MVDQDLNKQVNRLNIIANFSGNLIVKVLDIQGRIAKTIKEKVDAGAHKVALDFDDLKNGMYVVNIFNDGEFVKAVKLIKD